MTEAEAIAAAERVLALINSSPRTPSKEVIAAAIRFTRTVDVSSADLLRAAQRPTLDLYKKAFAAVQEAKERQRRLDEMYGVDYWLPRVRF